MYCRLSAITCRQAVSLRSAGLGSCAQAVIRHPTGLQLHRSNSTSTVSAGAVVAPSTTRAQSQLADKHKASAKSTHSTAIRRSASPNRSSRDGDDYWHSISQQERPVNHSQSQTRSRASSHFPSDSERKTGGGCVPKRNRETSRPSFSLPSDPEQEQDTSITPAQRRAVSNVYGAMASKHATNVLSNVRELLPLNNNDLSLNLKLVASIASCPYINVDQRAQWDLVVSEIIDSACSAAQSPNWPVHILLVTHLARAVARRQLRSHVPQVESLLQAFRSNPHPENATDPTAVSKLHMSMLTMYNNAGQATQSIAYFEQSVPVDAWSEHVLAVAAAAMAAHHDQSRIRAMLTRAAEAKVIEYPFANGSLNRAFLEAFATLESAVVALEAISAAVLARHKAESAKEAGTGAMPSPDGKRGGKLSGKNKYGKASQARNTASSSSSPAPAPMPVATEFSPINSHVIVSLLQRCSAQVKPLLVPRILAVADAHGVPRSADIVGWLIALKRDTYDLAGAMDLYQHYLRTSPDPVSVRLMCPVLDVLRQLGKYEDVRKAHARVLGLHARGLVNINTMYSMCAVRAVAETASVQEAERVFEEMVGLGVPRHPMVDGYLQRRKEGRPVFPPPSAVDANTDAGKPRRSRHSPVPNPHQSESGLQSGEHYYLSALHDLVHQDRITDALKLWREMIEVKHITPSTASIALFLNYYVTRGDVEGMETLLAFANRLNVKSSPKWTRALVALRIKAYGFANRHADGFRIWDEALAEGIVPDSSTQSLILDSCGFVKSKARLVAIMDLLIREQWGGTDVNIWTSAVEAFCRMGDLESALNVVHKILPLKGLEPDAKMVGTLITVEPRLNRPLKDKRVWELVDRVGGQEVFSAGVRFDEPRPV